MLNSSIEIAYSTPRHFGRGMNSADPIDQPLDRPEDRIEKGFFIAEHARHIQTQWHADERDDDEEQSNLDNCIRH